MLSSRSSLRVHSFPPVARHDARVLILGSMPGIASLEAGQYYAHPRNLFWPIMGDLVGAGLDKPYAERTAIVMARNIAVWDVLQSCVRPGSLDSAIEDEIPNDFAAFFAAHRDIAHVFFNGGKAQQEFRRHVLKTLPLGRDVTLTLLPSTSPAHAARSFDEKRRVWAKILDSTGIS